MGRAADRLNRVGNKLRTLPDEGVTFGSKAVKASVDAALRRDAGSDRRLSGIQRGVPQTVNVTKRRTGQLVVGRVMAGPKGQRAPWFWLEEGTKRGRRGAKVGRYNSARASRGTHPGTPAKRTWSIGVRAAEPQVSAEFVRLFKKALEG